MPRFATGTKKLVLPLALSLAVVTWGVPVEMLAVTGTVPLAGAV